MSLNNPGYLAEWTDLKRSLATPLLDRPFSVEALYKKPLFCFPAACQTSTFTSTEPARSDVKFDELFEKLGKMARGFGDVKSIYASELEKQRMGFQSKDQGIPLPFQQEVWVERTFTPPLSLDGLLSMFFLVSNTTRSVRIETVSARPNLNAFKKVLP
jgi:hypothetical protein